MIVVFSGLPGSGKSYKLGQVLIDVLNRNKMFYENNGAQHRTYWEQYVKDCRKHGEVPNKEAFVE